MAERKPDPARYNTPGAPELGKAVKIPSAPPAPATREKGPVFQPTPNPKATDQSATTPPAPTAAASKPNPISDEHQARLEYLRNLRNDKPKKSHKVRNTILIVLLVLLLMGGGAAAFWVYEKKFKDEPTAVQNTAKTSPQTDKETPSPSGQQDPFTKQMTTYESSNFSLSVDHPEDWEPAEHNGVLTITSPITTLTDANGQTTQGKVLLTVRPKQANPEELSKGNAVAVLESQKVDYTHPSAGQRGSTYISYLQFAETTTKGGMDGVYITGDAGYQYAGYVPKTDITSVDPLINVTFINCANEVCAKSAQSPLTISSTSWKGNLKDTVEAMLKSFTFQ